MPLYPFPDVPDAPGVPPVPRSPLFPPAADIGLGLLQGLIWRIFQVQTQWGIFDSSGQALGNPALFVGLPGQAAQSVGIGATLSTGSVTYRKNMRTSTFPVERGNFANYNKVEEPGEPTVVLCLDGTESDRAFFITAIEDATNSTELYNVVTPEKIYVNYSIDSYTYERRASRGATLLIFEIKLLEIRQVSAAYSQTPINDPKNPGATPQANTGVVQPQVPATSTLQSIAAKVPPLAKSATSMIQGLVQ